MKWNKIDLEGSIPSINKLYSNNWKVRYGIVKKWKGILSTLIFSKVFYKYDKFEVVVVHGGRYDCDNYVGLAKIFVDCLQTLGFIPDDDRRYYKKLTIKYDPDYDINQTTLAIREHE
jgi:hypothetical protein